MPHAASVNNITAATSKARNRFIITTVLSRRLYVTIVAHTETKAKDILNINRTTCVYLRLFQRQARGKDGNIIGVVALDGTGDVNNSFGKRLHRFADGMIAQHFLDRG